MQCDLWFNDTIRTIIWYLLFKSWYWMARVKKMLAIYHCAKFMYGDLFLATILPKYRVDCQLRLLRKLQIKLLLKEQIFRLDNKSILLCCNRDKHNELNQERTLATWTESELSVREELHWACNGRKNDRSDEILEYFKNMVNNNNWNCSTGTASDNYDMGHQIWRYVTNLSKCWSLTNKTSN